MSRQPAKILRYFSYNHLSDKVRGIAQEFYAFADDMDAKLPDCAEKSAGLRKLLEAKDCMIRAKLEEK